MKTISPRRILAAILLLALLLTALPIGVLAAELSFTDVPKNEWYYEDVRLAVEGGLVNGKSPTIYAPNDNVTYAETVKLAACIHKLTDTGSTEFAAGTVWYQPYVDYARSKQIISKDYDWNTAATRAHFMDIFSRAISSNPTLKGTKPLDAINTVEDGAIPDVPMTHPQAGSIYKLYRAGVVQGSDKQYSCKPNTNIRRSEVAAILTRMVYADKRLSFTVGDANALRITKQPQNVSGKATNTLKLSVEAAGGKTPYTYRWQVMDEKSSWTWISDEKNASFGGHKADTFWATGAYLTKASEKSWKFRCVVTDADGRSVTSEAAGMTLEASALKIITHPQDSTVSIDATGYVSYQVEASGGKTPYTYRWQRRTADTDWSDLSKNPRSAVEQTINNVDAQVLRISPGVFSSLAKRGYAFRCVVTDADGNSVTSNSAAFFVKTEELRITMQPMPVEAAPMDIAEFRTSAAGGRPPYRYQWEVSDDTMGWTWIDTLQDTSMYYDDAKGLLQVEISGYEWRDHVRYRNCFLRRHVKHTSYYRKHTMRDKRIAKKAADALAGGRAGTAFFDICSAAQISMDGGRYVMGAGVTEDEWNRHVNAIRRFPGRETPFLMYQEGELFCNFDPAAFCGRLCDTFHYILDVGAVVDRRAAWATVIDIVTERI